MPRAVHGNGQLRGAGESDWAVTAPRLGLCRRELEVTRGYFEGLKRAAIALELKLALATVDTYWKRARQNLGLDDRNAVVRHITDIVIELRVAEAVAQAMAVKPPP